MGGRDKLAYIEKLNSRFVISIQLHKCVAESFQPIPFNANGERVGVSRGGKALVHNLQWLAPASIDKSGGKIWIFHFFNRAFYPRPHSDYHRTATTKSNKKEILSAAQRPDDTTVDCITGTTYHCTATGHH